MIPVKTEKEMNTVWVNERKKVLKMKPSETERNENTENAEAAVANNSTFQALIVNRLLFITLIIYHFK
jgi:hypothetical protein